VQRRTPRATAGHSESGSNDAVLEFQVEIDGISANEADMNRGGHEELA